MNANLTFNVTAVNTAVAPEVLYLNPDNDKRTMPDNVGRLSVFINSLPAGSSIAVDVLKPGGEPGNASHWRLAAKTFNALGLQTLLEVANIVGVRIRGISGGTAGALEIDAHWHRFGD